MIFPVRKYKKNITGGALFSLALFALSGTGLLFAETVSGGGYVVQQVIAPIQGALSGNGYVLQSASQNIAGSQSGNGYTMTAPLGAAPAPVAPPSGGGGGGGTTYSGGGYFVLVVPPATTTVATSTKPIVPKPDPSKTIITENGSSCKTLITFSSPVDVGSKDNLKEDVEKLETFLNTYENEKLTVNGVYEVKDIAAVKKWQEKYRSFILDPMRLKKPTGTVYRLSQKQIERQTTKTCGQPILITACPYFKTYTKYGDRGAEVKKIQQFLNIVQGEKLSVSGIYGPATREAAKRFQRSKRSYVFSFVSFDFISGNWNVSTRTKANEVLGCGIIKS